MAVRPARLSLSLYDNRGNKGTFLTHANVDDTLTIANAATAINNLKTAYLLVGDGGVKDGSFTLLRSDIGADPGDDADLSAGATYDFTNSETLSHYGQFVPSYADGGFLPGGHINIGVSPNSDFVTAMLATVLGGHFTDTQYQNLAAGVDAFLANRKRKRRVR